MTPGERRAKAEELAKLPAGIGWMEDRTLAIVTALEKAEKAGEEKQRAEVGVLRANVKLLATHCDGWAKDHTTLGNKLDAAEARVAELEKEAANVAHFTRHREDVAQAKAEGKREGVEEAARECLRVWHAGIDQTERNGLSHGCIASEVAIRALLAPEPGKEER
jgi:hypothetical protein